MASSTLTLARMPALGAPVWSPRDLAMLLVIRLIAEMLIFGALWMRIAALASPGGTPLARSPPAREEKRIVS